MKQSLEQFSWGKPLCGYVWEDAKALAMPVARGDRATQRDLGETRFLRWSDSASQAVALNPLSENPTLFREFAELQPNESAYQQFAGQHGWLGVSCLLQGELTVDGKTRVVHFGDARAQGEAFWRWQESQWSMKRVSDVLAAIVDKNTDQLREWFHVLPTGVRYERTTERGREFAWISSPEMSLKPWLWKWANRASSPEARLLRFASGWAQGQINDAMSSEEKGSETSVRVLLNHERDAMALHIVPGTLLAAMWLQCARVLTENPTFKACEHCGKWFEVAPGSRRKNSKYCSDRCKVAAHRAKAIIPIICDGCGKRFNLGVAAVAGSGYMTHWNVPCPKCGKINTRLLPSAPTGVEK